MADAYILGIESSCDETAAAVVRSGEQVISNVVASQIAIHQPYGGVVPELASREHLRGIVPVVRRALEEARQSYESIDAIAVTQGPGLAGALLVGGTYGKALAFSLEEPLIAVNHLECHIQINNMRKDCDERQGKLAHIQNPTEEDVLAQCDRKTLDLIASFQRAIVEDLVGKTLKAAEHFHAATLFVTGGVAANSELRARFEQQAA